MGAEEVVHPRPCAMAWRRLRGPHRLLFRDQNPRLDACGAVSRPGTSTAFHARGTPAAPARGPRRSMAFTIPFQPRIGPR